MRKAKHLILIFFSWSREKWRLLKDGPVGIIYCTDEEPTHTHRALYTNRRPLDRIDDEHNIFYFGLINFAKILWKLTDGINEAVPFGGQPKEYAETVSKCHGFIRTVG